MEYFRKIIIASILLTTTQIGLAEVIGNDSYNCEASDQNLKHWRMIKAKAKSIDANDYAMDLLACLRSPNKELRDEIGYEVLSYWLRRDKLSAENTYEMKEQLLPWLSLDSGMPKGDSAYARAFSALILSELVRDDRRNSRWLGGDVDELVTLSTRMFINERDYRGLDPEHGWIHTIAHASDLLWRLSRHPKTMIDQQTEILSALTSQINRLGIPAYTFNESDRIARVAASIFGNSKVDLEFKQTWLMEVSSPAPWEKWTQAFSSQEGMARLHNVKHFLRALKESLNNSEDTEISESIDSALMALP